MLIPVMIIHHDDYRRDHSTAAALKTYGVRNNNRDDDGENSFLLRNVYTNSLSLSGRQVKNILFYRLDI